MIDLDDSEIWSKIHTHLQKKRDDKKIERENRKLKPENGESFPESIKVQKGHRQE